MAKNLLGGVYDENDRVAKTEGIIKLAEALPQTKIQDLKCAATCQTWQADQCQQPLTLVGHPLALFGSR